MCEQHVWHGFCESAHLGAALTDPSCSITSNLLCSCDVCLQGRTPLHWAAMGGRVDCVEALLERGAAPDVLDALDCTPLDMAVGERVPDIVEIESLIRVSFTARRRSLDMVRGQRTRR